MPLDPDPTGIAERRVEVQRALDALQRPCTRGEQRYYEGYAAGLQYAIDTLGPQIRELYAEIKERAS